MSDPSSALLYMQIAIALATTISSVAMIWKAISFHADLRLLTIIFLVSTVVLCLLGVHIPLFFLSDSSRIQYHLTADVMMFGAAGLIAIAIIGFAVDHMMERPSWLIVAAAACMSIGLFPFVYQLSQEHLNQLYQINIIEPDKRESTLESILNRRTAPQGNDNNAEQSDESGNSDAGKTLPTGSSSD